MLPVLFLIIQLGFVIYLSYYIITFISGAPFVPSTKGAAAAMLRMTDIQKGMKIYDLGSGDGRLLFLAAKNGARAVGYELNPILVFITTIRIIFSPYRASVTVYWKSLWNADIRDADVVFVYLLPIRLDRLQQKLLAELKPGTLVVSNSFIFKNWPVTAQDSQAHVYVFTVPKARQLTAKGNQVQ
jgi:SAM-dependent methyltransferase